MQENPKLLQNELEKPETLSLSPKHLTLTQYTKSPSIGPLKPKLYRLEAMMAQASPKGRTTLHWPLADCIIKCSLNIAFKFGPIPLLL